MKESIGCVQAVFARITFRSADFPSSCTARISFSLRHCHLSKFCLKFLILLQNIFLFPQISSVLLKRSDLKNGYETIIKYNFISTKKRGRWRKWRFPGNFKHHSGIILIFSFSFYYIDPFIQFRLRNGKHKSSTSLLFKFFHEEESDKKSPKTTRRRERLILPGYPEMVFRY